MSNEPNALRWAAVFCVTGVRVDVQISVSVEQFAFDVRSRGYVQAPGVYVAERHIIAIIEIPQPAALPGSVSIQSPAAGMA